MSSLIGSGIGLALFSLLLGACNLPLAAGAGPRAWIDYPSNGMSFTSGTVVIQSHSTGPAAIRQAALYVDGVEARTDLNPDPSQSLVALSHPWVPPGPGEYMLQVRAKDASGNEGVSLPVRIVVIACPTPAGGGPVPDECEPIAPPEVVVGITLPPGEVVPGPAVCVEPTATFKVNANCRAGPGVAYPAQDTMYEGDAAEIVGKSADGSWLMVRRAGGSACWVSAITLEACGDMSAVQVIQSAPPPQAPEAPQGEPPPGQPPAPSQPAAPGGLSVSDHVCAGTTYSVTLSWADLANNEDGFRVYRNGGLLANLGAGATDYTDHPPQGGPYSYRVEAYNGAGAASASTSDSGCLF